MYSYLLYKNNQLMNVHSLDQFNNYELIYNLLQCNYIEVYKLSSEVIMIFNKEANEDLNVNIIYNKNNDKYFECKGNILFARVNDYIIKPLEHKQESYIKNNIYIDTIDNGLYKQIKGIKS